MGVWGIGPFDNDDAGDMIAGLMKKVYAVTEAKTDARAQKHYYEARAVVQFVLTAHGTDILGGPGLADPLRALARMRSDVDWLSNFRQPKKIAKTIQGEMAAILFKMGVCKDCRRDKIELNLIYDLACETKVPPSTWPVELGKARTLVRKNTEKKRRFAASKKRASKKKTASKKR